MVRMFGPAALITVLGWLAALTFGGPAVFVAVAVLSVLEISLSFDNAVVNAKVLGKMSPLWQKLFLTVGILVAVFGMRLVLPILIVSITADMSPWTAWDLALHDPEAYQHNIEAAKYSIYAFGGMFLLMIFLNMFLDDEKDSHWLGWIERPLAKIGKLDTISVAIALGALWGAATLAPAAERLNVWVAGAVGLIVYLVVNAINELMEDDEDEDDEDTAGIDATKVIATGGFAAFLYLEMLDASFSLDGVVGAFAISNEILVIALGLGIGAFWVRSMTIYLVRKGTLEELVYLEHGAHWAIGALATIMLLEMRFEVSEYVTGLLGVFFILLAGISSVRAKRASDKVEAVAAGEAVPAAGGSIATLDGTLDGDDGGDLVTVGTGGSDFDDD